MLVGRLDDVLHGDGAVRPARVLGAALAEQLAHVGRVAEDHEVLGAHLEADDVAVRLAPLVELEVRLVWRHLVQVAQAEHRRRSRREAMRTPSLQKEAYSEDGEDGDRCGSVAEPRRRE